MALATKSTTYAPDIFRALKGILLVYKPHGMITNHLIRELKERISDSLNEYEPRPLAKRLQIEGDLTSEKRIVEVPNLADHPLVVGPRYLPWEIRISLALPRLEYRSSGLEVLILGDANRFYLRKLNQRRMISVYHITGCFGHITDNLFDDGKIIDKSTFHHIRPGKIDGLLARIESSQRRRLFDSSHVPMDSREAYELAKSWPSRPPMMASWPVIYRIRCIHLALPIFKLEVTCVNENETFLAELVNDLGQMLKSGAHTRTIRRVKLGPFDVNDSLTDKDWNLPSIIEHLKLFSSDYRQLHQEIDDHIKSPDIRVEHKPRVIADPRNNSNKIAIKSR